MYEQCYLWNIAEDPQWLRNLSLRLAFLRVDGSMLSGKGYYHQKTFQVCLEKAEPCQYLSGNHSKIFLGSPGAQRWSLVSLHHRGHLGLHGVWSRPRGWVFKSFTLFHSVFIWKNKKRILFLCILEIIL